MSGGRTRKQEVAELLATLSPSEIEDFIADLKARDKRPAMLFSDARAFGEVVMNHLANVLDHVEANGAPPKDFETTFFETAMEQATGDDRWALWWNHRVK